MKVEMELYGSPSEVFGTCECLGATLLAEALWNRRVKYTVISSDCLGWRFVRVHDPVIPALARWAAHPITLLHTTSDSSWLARFFSIPPVCQYESRSCADGPIVAVKMIYYIQRVSYQITCKETAHVACQ